MFEALRHSLKIAKLQRERRRTMAWYEAAIKKARIDSKLESEWQSLVEQEIHDLAGIADKMARLQTFYWREKAESRSLTIPEFSTDQSSAWERASTGGHYQLKKPYLEELRSRVRKDINESRQAWLPLVSLIVAGLGCTVGILGLFLRR